MDKAGQMTRRGLMARTAAVGILAAAGQAASAQAKTAHIGVPETQAIWLDRDAPSFAEGQTFGVPWPRGSVAAKSAFSLGDLPVQSWPIAYWPDGSLKWSAHAVGPLSGGATSYALKPGTPAAPAAPLTVAQTGAGFTITSGDLVWTVPGSGKTLISGATRSGKPAMGAVTLSALTQDAASFEDKPDLKQTTYDGVVEKAVLEQQGPVRTTLRLEGRHSDGSRQWLPFTVRLYFYAGSDAVRIVHSFIFDGDETKDFIRGLGVSAEVPMTDELYNRHLRFSGENDGVWGEAVRSLTGLRRDPGKAAREAQIAGTRVDPSMIAPSVGDNLHNSSYWNDFTCSQATPDGYTIRKRVEPGHAFIESAADHRASGLAYVGSPQGGVALGLKDFWQRAPTRLDIRNAATDTASVTAWLWSPDAPAMDIRPYRPDWGMDTYAKQNEGLLLTYEDFEPGWNKPYGIARTSELTLWALPATPERQRFADMATALSTPPRLTVAPERLHMIDGLFGAWSLPNSSTPTRALIEGRISYQLDYYLQQIEERKWYGFWDYGDVMHTYDADRHVWRYDIGGFAWDNSELQSDMMFWYGYLRSGRADVFRMAEAMTRHTSEVDTFHIGPYKGFGTRHGIQHWSDSSKQPRVSNAAFKRFYYYLTADERVGDLMHDLIDSDQTLKTVYIERKVAAPGGSGIGIRKHIEGTVDCSFGTSWGSFIAAWLTEWERTGDTHWRDRILIGMNSIAKLKYGWFCGGAPYDLKTGAFVGPGDQISVSHLNAVFGIIEITEELMTLVDAPAYKKTWLDYCKYYNSSPADIKAFLGVVPRDRSLRDASSRMTAYAARELKDPALAARAWSEFFEGDNPRHATSLHPQEDKVTGPNVLYTILEDPTISTNGASQWGLAAIENLELIGDSVEANAPR
ncbi:Tat pathway signal sequence domain protein [Asticcacaulis sp. EMRT-3]|uniref:exo-rhamnogalacturonan lyase family protein n=1 Tax=Asticcacaulis sp. EMRT-3 TaxID=3040349 RepID=UPI0024AF74A7|nr:Tat pathway signal sequence domain protein [Asticcacaulis sp. EMRT-3]MDI7776411.1 Tat pathway signal sequence domain protein [Asticcacaulis sp. EMRT-3]